MPQVTVSPTKALCFGAIHLSIHLTRVKARILLAECRGDEIWSLSYCESRGIPDAWVQELEDCFESGFANRRDTIFYQGNLTNQFHGVRDLDLALRLAEFLGVDTRPIVAYTLGDVATVIALKEAVEE
jgi:hypothetical protein